MSKGHQKVRDIFSPNTRKTKVLATKGHRLHSIDAGKLIQCSLLMAWEDHYYGFSNKE